MCGSKRSQKKKDSQTMLVTTKQQTLSFSKPPPSQYVDLTTDEHFEAKAIPTRKRRVPSPTPTTMPPRTQVQKCSFPIYTRCKTYSFSQQEIDACLRNVFQLASLRRNLQSEAVQIALRQQSQLLVLATGGGKSLCYQLPSCLLGGVTIVISPLIALMQDQIAALGQKGIPAAHLSSQQTLTENNQVLARLVDTQVDPLTLLYITPESIQTDKMRTVLQQLHEQKRLTMFAIDEAHCLSR
jgi:superfamily II DNA helicase RecQ